MNRLKVKTEALEKAQAECKAAICAEQEAMAEWQKARDATPKISLQEARTILLTAPDMEQLDAVLKEWGFEPDDFDDWREEMGDPQEVAVIYHAEGGAFVKLYATPLPEGYGPANGATMIPARMDDNWLFGVEGLEKWGSGADALRATLEELFEKEAA